VWVDALWAWPTLTRCPTQASGISFSDIVSDIAATLRARQLRLKHSEVFAQQHVRAIEREVRPLASRQALILISLGASHQPLGPQHLSWWLVIVLAHLLILPSRLMLRSIV
jgi:hypothetical protein